MRQGAVGSTIENIADLTPLQDGMVFHALEDPAGRAYVVQQVFRFPDPVDPERLRAAAQALTARHPILRTAFVAEKVRRPRQVVLADRPLPVTHLDLTGQATEQADALRQQHLRDAIATPFDLAQDPLVRIALLRREDATGAVVNELAWTYHHIVLDGWSVSLLLTDLLRYLSLAADHVPHELTALARAEQAGETPFTSYARWIQDHRPSDSEGYWAEALDGYETIARFPAGSTGAGDGVARVRRTSSTGLAERLVSRFAGTGITLAHIAQAAFGLVLGRACGADDVVFGSVVSGRDVPMSGIESTAGLFINTIPVRVTAGPGTSVGRLLDSVRDQAIASGDHATMPLARVQSHTGHDNLVQALFAFENFQADDETFAPGGGLTYVEGREQTTYPVTLAAQRIGAEIDLTALVNTADHTPEDGERIVERVLHVLEQFAHDAEASVGSVSTLTPSDHLALTEFNRTAGTYETNGSLPAVFAESAAAFADRIAVVDRDEKVSYADLASRAGTVAGMLRDAGVRAGDRVGIVGDPGAGLIAGLLGIVTAGGVYVPVDADTPAERARHTVQDSGLDLVVVTADRARSLVASWGTDVRVLDITELPVKPGTAALPAVGGSDPAYVMYTSGTTGLPKGVAVPHRAVLRLVRGSDALPWSERDALVQTGAVTFDASTFEIWGPLLNGGTLVTADKDDVLELDTFRALITRNSVTVMWLTVSLFNQIVTTDPGVLDGVDRVVIGGERVSADHVARLYAVNSRVQVINGYGPTENTTFTTTHPIDRRVAADAVVPIGRPVPGTRVHILAAPRNPAHQQGEATHRVCGVGETGELCAAGDGLATGYLNDPDLTAEKFVALPDSGERVYRTGDLARWNADGTIEFLGRIDDHQLKVRGFRVEVGEIEAAIRATGLVRDVVVTGHRPEPGAPLALIAYVVPSDAAGDELPGVLRGALAGRLPGYMVPGSFTLIDRIPLTRNGKLDRAALPAPAPLLPAAQDRAEPRGEAEEVVCAAFGSALGLGSVGALDNFFEAGGDSISAIRVVSTIRQAGYDVTVSRVMAEMTPRGIARTMRRSHGRQEAGRGPVTGPVAGVPVIEDFFAWGLAVPEHFNQDLLVDVAHATAGQVRAALDAIWRQHDALRATVTEDTLVIRTPERARYGFEHIDLAAGDTDDAFSAAMHRAQGGMRFGPDGVLLHAVLATGRERRSRLFLTAHHLVVDIVSWHIIAEDLRTALDSVTGSGSDDPDITLPGRSGSVIEWGRALRRLGEQVPAAAREYWTRVDAESAGALVPASFGHESADGSHFADVELDEAVSLDVSRVAEMYLATVEDVVLTAVASGVGAVTGLGRIAVRLERHGRHEHDQLPPVDRTVGWFTSMHPVVLEAGSTESPGDHLVTVKETLRQVPDGGRDYGLLPGGLARMRASVTFNYLGSTHDAATENLPVTAGDATDTGSPSHPANRFHHGIRVNARIQAGRLRVHLAIDHSVLAAHHARDLGPQIRAALTELARHGRTLDRPRRTSSDHSVAIPLDQAELTRLEGEYDVADIAEPTPLQEGMIFHALEDPAGSAFIVQQVFRLPEPVGAAALRAAVDALTARHPILRTAFVAENLRHARQVVLTDRPLPVTELDLRRQTPADADSLRTTSLDDATRPFDLARDPLVRITHLRSVDASGTEHQELAWTYHHIVLDGWSLALLFGDLLRYLSLAPEHAADELSSLARSEQERETPFTRYTRWIRESGANGDVPDGGHDAFWAEVLDGYDTTAAFPATREPGGPVVRVVGASSTRLAERLHQRWAGTGVTLAHLTQTAYALVLARACGSDDVVFGNVVSGRDVPLDGIGNTVGLFINTVPLRVTFTPGVTVTDVLARVREQSLRAAHHATAPLDRIQQKSGHTQLIHALFAFENYRTDAATFDAATGLSYVEGREQTTSPMTLAAQQAGADIELTALANSSHHTPDDAERITERVLRVLEQFADDATMTISAVSTPVPTELRTIAEDFNAADATLRDESLGTVFARTAADFADRVAVVDGDQRVSYADLARGADTLAARLRTAGVRPESLVGVVGAPGAALITGLLGIVTAGAGYVPMDLDAPAERCRYSVADAGLSVIVVTSDHARDVVEAWGTEARIVVVGTADQDATAATETAADPGPGGDAPAYVMYTSGTTGRPKGVAVPHRAVLRLVRGSHSLPLSERDVLVQTGTVTFDASTFEIWGMLLNGGTLITAAKDDVLDLRTFRTLIERNGVTVLWLTVSLFNQIVATDRQVLDGVERVVIGGEAVSAHHVARLYEVNPDIQVINGYGPTENTTFTTTHPIVREIAPGDPVPIGRPVTGTRVHILAPDDGADTGFRVCGIGETGELCAAGDGLATGYVNDPGLTAERFIVRPDGERLYRTGDLARWKADGTIAFLGRIDDQQLKVRGFRIEVGEVAGAIRETGLVRDVVVVGHRFRPQAPVTLCAYVVRHDTGDTEEGTSSDTHLAQAIRERLSERLPGYAVPGSVTVVDRIPLTRNGKLDRTALRAPLPDARPARPLETGLETRVATAWAEVLGRTDIGPDDNFFELGGTSLTLIQLRTQFASRELEPLSIGELFTATTVRAQARRMRGTGDGVLVLHRTGLAGGEGGTSQVTSSRPWQREDTAAAAYAFTLALESMASPMPGHILLWGADGVVAVDVPALGEHGERVRTLEQSLRDARPLDPERRVRFEGRGSLPILRLPEAAGVAHRVLVDESDLRVALTSSPGGTIARTDGRRGRTPQATTLLHRFTVLLDRLIPASR